MFYRIRRPSNMEEWPIWTPFMDYLHNKLINLNDYEIKETLRYEAEYIVIDDHYINVNWLQPSPNAPKKIEKKIRG